MLPPNAAAELAATHNQLGRISGDAGRLDTALDHFRHSIRYSEVMGDRFHSGMTRRNAARYLAGVGRFLDAREWTRAALRDFEAAPNADRDIFDTAELLKAIESDLQATAQRP
jgi:hypothetical protein